MKKEEYIKLITDDLQVIANNKKYINLTQFASYLGISRGKAKVLLNNEPFLPNGREKLYYANDIAHALWEQSERR